MKKLFVIFLCLAFLLPSASLADQDPIIGTWYIDYETADKGDDQSDLLFWINIFHFTEDGKIISSKYDIGRDFVTTVHDYKTIGLWYKEDGQYYVNISLSGAKEIYWEDDTLFFPVTDIYVRIRRMEKANFVFDTRK